MRIIEYLDEPGWRWVVGFAAFSVLVTAVILFAKYLPDEALSFIDLLAEM